MAGTVNLSDSVGVVDTIYMDVEMQLSDSVEAGDILYYFHRFLRLARRVFTLRLRA